MNIENSANQTLDQRRAAHAWNAVVKLKQCGASDQKDYAGEAKKLPIRIMTSGLGQALAFLLSKAKEKKRHLRQLHDDLTEWALGHRGLAGPVRDSLLQSIIQADSDFLRQATDEVLAYLQWLNRFNEAEGLRSDDLE